VRLIARARKIQLHELRALPIIIHSRQCLPNRIAGAEIEKAVQQVNAKRQEQKEQRLLETSF
jgi:capsule polysaccharide export protein KpsC/LpsZ